MRLALAALAAVAIAATGSGCRGSGGDGEALTADQTTSPVASVCPESPAFAPACRDVSDEGGYVGAWSYRIESKDVSERLADYVTAEWIGEGYSDAWQRHVPVNQLAEGLRTGCCYAVHVWPASRDQPSGAISSSTKNDTRWYYLDSRQVSEIIREVVRPAPGEIGFYVDGRWISDDAVGRRLVQDVLSEGLITVPPAEQTNCRDFPGLEEFVLRADPDIVVLGTRSAPPPRTIDLRADGELLFGCSASFSLDQEHWERFLHFVDELSP